MSHAVNLSLAALLAASTVSAQDKKEEFKETYEAFAVAMGTSNPPVIPSGMATTLQINITRWTTDEEREKLFAIVIEKGQEDLVEALRKRPDGSGLPDAAAPAIRFRASGSGTPGSGTSEGEKAASFSPRTATSASTSR